MVELPDLANKNAVCLPKVVFQMQYLETHKKLYVTDIPIGMQLSLVCF